MNDDNSDAVGVESQLHLGGDAGRRPRRSSIQLMQYDEQGSSNKARSPKICNRGSLEDHADKSSDSQRLSSLGLVNNDVYLLLQHDRNNDMKVPLEQGLQLIGNRSDSEEPTAQPIERQQRASDDTRKQDDTANCRNAGKAASNARYSPLLDNLRLMQMMSGKEQHEIVRKPRDSIDSRRSSAAGEAVNRRGSGEPGPGSGNTSRRDSWQNQQMDHKQFQLHQLQRLKYWEQRQRRQQQTKEIEMFRQATQQQQILQLQQQLQQQQYISQWQQQQQQQLFNRHRQQVQQALLSQQERIKSQIHSKARRTSAPTLQTPRPADQKLAKDFAAKMNLQQAAAAAAAAAANPAMVTAVAKNQMSAEQAAFMPGVLRAGWPLFTPATSSISPLPGAVGGVHATHSPHVGVVSPAGLAPKHHTYSIPTPRSAGRVAVLDSANTQPSQTTGGQSTVPSLMTEEEKEWIKQLHRQSIPTGKTVEHFNSDYYCIKLGERKARRDGKPMEPFTLNPVDSQASPSSGVISTTAEQGPEGTSTRETECNPRMSSAQQRSRASRATTLPDVLGGRVSSSSSHFEREIVDLVSDSVDTKPPHSTKSMSASYRALLAVEQAFDKLLSLEEYERQTSVSQGDTLLISQPAEREKTLRSIMSLLGFRPDPDVMLINDVLGTSKGVSLVARVLPAIAYGTAQQVALMAFSQLSLVGSSQECDIYGIRNVLPALARSMVFVVKQCDLTILLALLENLLRLPDASDGSPGAVAVLCYGGAAVATLFSTLITCGFDACLSLESTDGTLSRDIIYWRHLTMKLYYLLEFHSAMVSEDDHAKMFFSQLILHAGSSFTDMFMQLEGEAPATSGMSRHRGVSKTSSLDSTQLRDEYRYDRFVTRQNQKEERGSLSRGSNPTHVRESTSMHGDSAAAFAHAHNNISHQHNQQRKYEQPHQQQQQHECKGSKSVTIVRLDCR